ncbi:polysaccharide biosynthesis/export family protein [Mailhella sp.]|uniref:polysaccharide biosynthesis/export family protein n=1 Tax=Mailhella sp. TaxID=1981029 RepID=UPI004063CB3F
MSAFRTLTALLLSLLTWNADARAADACDIRSGDLLSVYVYRQEDMCLRVRVDSEGFIRFPVAGRIEARGRQPEQIGRSITAALRRHGFVSPDVVVSVESYAPRTVFVLGEIQAGGSVSCLIPEGGKMTAMQALSAAGGLAPSADPARIAVRRQDASGAASIIPVPALDILRGGNAADVLLQPFDTVVVPRARAVAVLGAVKSPGEFYITPDGPLTLSRAVALAGGAERPKSLSAIRVTRGAKSFLADLFQFLEEGRGHDIELEAGDIVYVPESRW